MLWFLVGVWDYMLSISPIVSKMPSFNYGLKGYFNDSITVERPFDAM